MSEIKSKDICAAFWTTVPGRESFYSCTICKIVRKQGPRSYANLFDHLEDKHPDYKEVYLKQLEDNSDGAISKIYGATSKAKNIHSWIRQVVY